MSLHGWANHPLRAGAQVAQLVEHATENRRVVSSSLTLSTSSTLPQYCPTYVQRSGAFFIADFRLLLAI